MSFTSLIIDGEERGAEDAATFEVTNPLSQLVVGSAASASLRDCDSAIEAASTAFKSWQNSTHRIRRAIFERALERLQQPDFKETMVDVFQDEIGVNEVAASFNWAMTVAFTSTVIASLDSLVEEEYISSMNPTAKITVKRKPLGVIFSCAPWNLPGGLTALAAYYPIIFGNTVVLKPSEYTPRSQALLVQVLHDSGLPRGVLNYIPMTRENAKSIVPKIIAHSAVMKIVFIGSLNVGKIMAKEAAKHLKPCFLELGGKAPVVVLDDADLEKAAEAIDFGGFWQSGQACIATERVIVLKSVFEKLIPIICACAKEQKPRDPLLTKDAVTRFLSMVQGAVKEGAELLVPTNISVSEGKDELVVGPHVLSGMREGMELWDVESFGPALSIMIVESEEEAIEAANKSGHSLTAAVWSRDVKAAMKVGARLRSGYVNINGPTVYCEPKYPIVSAGAGPSGYGEYGFEAFTYRQVTVANGVQAHVAHGL